MNMSISIYGLFNLGLWVIFWLACSGMAGESWSQVWLIVPFFFSLMYAGAVYQAIQKD